MRVDVLARGAAMRVHVLARGQAQARTSARLGLGLEAYHESQVFGQGNQLLSFIISLHLVIQFELGICGLYR